MNKKVEIARRILREVEARQNEKIPKEKRKTVGEPENITSVSDPTSPTHANALRFSMKLIGLRRRSEAEILKRLQVKGFDKIIQTAVVRELKKWHYLDDAEFAASYLHDRIRFHPRGRTRLRQELRQLGVKDTVIEAALQENLSAQDELLLAEKLVIKKLNALRDKDRQTVYNKLIFHLKSKGFSAGLAGQAIRRAQNLKDND